MAKGVDFKSMNAADVMGTKPISILPEETISIALGKMKKHDTAELAVMKGDNIVGVLSYAKLIKRRNLPLSTRVEHIMSIPPKIRSSDKMAKVAEIFISTDYGSVPVIKGKKLEGFISRRDIVKNLRNVDEVSKMTAEDIMTGNPVCVTEKESVSKAMHIMRGLDEMGLPVVDKAGRLKGLVTAKSLGDYLKKPKRTAPSKGRKGELKNMNIVIKSLMNTNYFTVDKEAEVKDIIDLMIKKKQSYILVIEDDKPVGIVTERDIIEALAGLVDREEVYVQISGLEDQDPMVYDDMYNLIGRHLKKISKIYTPRIFNAHVVHHHQPDDLTKYTVHCRLTTDKGSFTTQEYDWDLFQALDDALDHLHTMVLKLHERTVDSRKKSGKRRR